jgi:hypothetical protein
MPFQRHPDVCAAELDGEICLFHPHTARYLALNATGSAIWQLLERPMDLKGLVSALQDQFEVDDEPCREHTSAFLGEALVCGMLQEGPVP